MKIRSITFFLDPGWPLDEARISAAGSAAKQASERITEAGYEVQTIRLATPPFPLLFKGLEKDALIDAVQSLERAAVGAGFEYTAIGPALIETPEHYALIPEIIAATENIFCSAEMASRRDGLSLPAVEACARIIADLAPQDPNGFANLYFSALANVPAGSPFFPAAYHDGSEPGFALATEAAGLAVSAFEDADDLQAGLEIFVAKLDQHAGQLAAASDLIAEETGYAFKGIDFSLAPFPDERISLGAAVEAFGVPAVGQHGSLAAAAMLAASLDRADIPRVGFSGLFFPLLEDSALAERAAEGLLSVKDLLLYSAVCGTGLDTIPLPGETSPEHLAPVLLDLASLALRLDKPLTARLMPIPGKQAGDLTSFDFPFFANSRVLPLEAEPLSPPLVGSGQVALKPRQKASHEPVQAEGIAAILSQVQEGVIVIDDDGVCQYVNPSARRAFRLEDADLSGKKVEEIFQQQNLITAITGSTPDQARVEVQGEENTFYQATSLAIPGIGRVVTLHDITYLKELNRMKTEFVNTVSHDLRSPLTSILGYVELIRRAGDVNRQQSDYIQQVQESVHQITTLINEVLDLGKIESRLDRNFELISLNKIVRDVIASMKPRIDQKSLQLSSDLATGQAVLLGDEIQLWQMIENLLGNAIKYTPQGGEIAIQTSKEEDQVILRVRDTGVGIPLEDQNKIFQPFFRADNVVEDSPGTGLGLAITKTVVDNHRGRIWVDSAVGQGSTFTVVLPMIEKAD